MEPQQPSYDPNSSNQNPNPNPTPTPAQTYSPAPTPPVDSSMQSPAVSSPAVSSPAVESAQAAPAALPTWPGAFGVYKTSKEAVRLNIGTVILLILATIAVSIVFDIFFKDEIAFIGDIASFLITSLFSVATVLVYLAGVRGQKLGFGDSLSKSVPFWVGMIALSILTSLLLAASLLLLIVPFFFVFPRVALAPYYLIDKKAGVVEALKTSWSKTKGHVGKVYGIVGVNLAFGLLCVTIIGIPFAIYFFIMYSAATALLFNYINKQSDSPSAPLV